MEPSALIRRSLAEFFRDVLRGAMQTHAVRPSEPTEHYLVALLEHFAKPGPDWDARPLALDYLESFELPRPRRLAALRRVGDTALFLSGVFMESLERRIVSTDYYIGIGRLAYHQLAGLVPSDVFGEMAARFPDFVRLLSELTFEDMFRGDARTVRVYTRWLRTRGQQDAEWLLRRGIAPFDPGVRSRH
ncbi:MAG: hypothetical protein U0802_06795 [Candidatus Binatia bacterium]